MSPVTGQALKGVYGITDENLLEDQQLLPRVEEALQGGIRLLQYRNKNGGPELRLRQARDLAILCHDYGVPLLINDDVRLCLQSGADGVHLGQTDSSPEQARVRLGRQAIIGMTCHNSPEAALRAQQAGASYVAMGRFFASRTKPRAPGATIEDLRRARAGLEIPLVAIGGITPDNGGELLQAGADMLAVIHYLFSAPDAGRRARALRALFTPEP